MFVNMPFNKGNCTLIKICIWWNDINNNILVTCENVISVILKNCKVKQVSDDRGVWCEIINAFKSYDYWDIVCLKLWILVQVSSSYRKLNSGQFFETWCRCEEIFERVNHVPAMTKNLVTWMLTCDLFVVPNLLAVVITNCTYKSLWSRYMASSWQ